MGKGTRYPQGVIDGVFHTEAGSLTLGSGGTGRVTTSFDLIKTVCFTADSVTRFAVVTSKVNAAEASYFDVKGSVASAFKVYYVVVGVRTKQYS